MLEIFNFYDVTLIDTDIIFWQVNIKLVIYITGQWYDSDVSFSGLDITGIPAHAKRANKTVFIPRMYQI